MLFVKSKKLYLKQMKEEKTSSLFIGNIALYCTLVEFFGMEVVFESNKSCCYVIRS